MVMDTLGLAISVTLTWLTRNSAKARQALPLVAFPLLAVGDLVSIYYELKAIHLRSLNHERAELIAAHWLAHRRVPSARQVCRLARPIAVLLDWAYDGLPVMRQPIIIG